MDTINEVKSMLLEFLAQELLYTKDEHMRDKLYLESKTLSQRAFNMSTEIIDRVTEHIEDQNEK